MVRAVPTFAVVGLLALGASCRPERPSARPPEKVPEARTDSQRDTPVARIGTRLITYGEVDDLLSRLPVHSRARYQSAEGRLEFVEAYVQSQLLATEAAKAGYASDPVVVDRIRTDLAARYLREHADREVRVADIPDEDVRRYYDEHLGEFVRPAQRRILHLRVADEARARRLARRAQVLCGLAGVAGDREFSRIATEVTEDESTRASGGDLGWLPRPGGAPSGLPAEVEKAAMALGEVLDVSGPVRAPDGWHVLFLSGLRDAEGKSLEQARPRIVALLLERERERRRRALSERLVAAAGVVVDEEAARKVPAQGGSK